MTRQKHITILGVVLVFVCVARAGLAQTEATNTTQLSGDQGHSTAALAQVATNAFSNSWLMQIQQNNNWTDMPLNQGSRRQSNLAFQPCPPFSRQESVRNFVCGA